MWQLFADTYANVSIVWSFFMSFFINEEKSQKNPKKPQPFTLVMG